MLSYGIQKNADKIRMRYREFDKHMRNYKNFDIIE